MCEHIHYSKNNYKYGIKKMDTKKICDYHIDSIEIYQICSILYEYLENYIDHEPVIDKAHALSKVIMDRMEILKDNLDELVSEAFFQG